MGKYFVIIISVLVLAAGWAYAQNGRYVRKTVEPDFFMPEKDKFHQPEKLPPVVLPVSAENEEAVAEESSEKVTPEYQKKYEEYQQDLQNVAKDGEVAPNQGLQETLGKMTSGSVFEVKKTPSQNSDVKENFEKVLDESLQQN